MITIEAARRCVLSEKSYEKWSNSISAKKRKQLARFRFKEDALRSLMGELLVRRRVCKDLGYSNEKIVFETNAYGKPYLKGQSDFFFNISHTKDWIVCATSKGEIGVDVEEIKNPKGNIAKVLCTVNEYEKYRSLSETEGLKFFFNLWTQKESYIKAIGKGLHMPLKAFEVEVEENYFYVKGEREKYYITTLLVDEKNPLSVCTPLKYEGYSILKIENLFTLLEEEACF